MGNARSIETDREEDIWWTNGDRHTEEQSSVVVGYEEDLNPNIDQKACVQCEPAGSNSEREKRKREMEADFIKFKQELAREHERRREIIRERKKEMVDLRDELIREKGENERLRRLLEENGSYSKPQETEVTDIMTMNSIKEENEELRNEVEKLKLILREKDVIADKNRELRISLAEMQRELQNVNTQIISFEKERIDYQEHVTALKDIIRVTKEMLRVRESQIEELKKKISSIEELLASKEISILSDDLRQEYERQLRNIRDLRALYEDRQRVDRREKEKLQSQIEELKKNAAEEEKKNGELTERITELEEDNSKKYDKIVGLESNLGLSKAECRDLRAEMDVINQLFSQILISFNNDQEVDLDNMIKILEENHALLTNIVINDESNQTSALPKVLLDLVNQVNESRKENKETPVLEEGEELPPHPEKIERLDTITEEEEAQLTATHQLNSPEEIVENLPKVWRVLIELLSHQCAPNNEIAEKKGENDNHCYKSVETPTGLREVLSVSKTFIRLKSLILEKKSLEKETTRLKQLNTHLEGRLSDQEKRLALVSNELSKTWNFVGKMQKQHQQLHTQEKILRYELAQKRKLLTELKEELEYCRQKWSEARKQNSSTEEQWKQLRTEFASRKMSIAEDGNNSVESGYSDDKSSSDDEDADFHAKPQLVNQSNLNEDIQQPAESESKELIEEASKNNDNSMDSNELALRGDQGIESVGSERVNQSNLNVDVRQPAAFEDNELVEEPLTSQDDPIDCEKSKPRVDGGLESVNNEEVPSDSRETPPLDSPGILHPSQIEKTDIEDVNDRIEVQNGDSLSLESTEPVQSTQDIPIDKSQSTPVQHQSPYASSTEPTQNVISSTSTVLDSVKDCIQKTNGELPLDLHEETLSSSTGFKGTQTDQPSSSHKNPVEAAAEFAARREERMKRLEEQCKDLYFSVAKNSLRGLVMSNKLDNLHEMYGESSQETPEEPSSTSNDAADGEEECQSSPVLDSKDEENNQE